jgi:D-beta-D-heptose 7-phosphate kinase/D-beta-D-heptose 1-phosphate adenosyltransferase
VEDDEFEQVRQSLGVDHLLVTLGGDGMALATAGQPIRTTPSIAREVFDVSGAGDTVTAWTAAVLGSGGEVGEGAWIANLAAGVEVGKLGTATVSQQELLEAWDLVEQPE